MPKRVFPAKDVPFAGLYYIYEVKKENIRKMGGNRHFATKSAK